MKHFCILLLLALFSQECFSDSSIWDGTSSDKTWYDGNQVEYHISTAAQFKGLADLVDKDNILFDGKTVFLDSDIDLNGKNWTPLGISNSRSFKGVFDGQNHSINNIYISTNTLDYSGAKNYIGLFGYANEIRNLKVQGTIDNSDGRYVGGIVGVASTVKNVHSDFILNLKNNISSGDYGTVAGMISEEGLQIEGKGTISFDNGIYMIDGGYVGGIAGYCKTLSECSSSVNVSIRRYGNGNNMRVGGVIGSATSISDAIFTGTVGISNIGVSNDMFFPCVGGISGFLSKGDCLISAPETMNYGRGFANGKSVLVPQNANATISHAYYLDYMATQNEPNGTSVTDSRLRSGEALDGFSTDKWVFTQGEYPMLKAFVESKEPDRQTSDLNYEFDDFNLTATVIERNYAPYKGNIVVPETVEKYDGMSYTVNAISSSAFYNTDITSIIIPQTVTNIYDFSFHHCDSLMSITIKEGNTVYDSRNQCNAIIETASNKLLSGCRTTTIPYGVSIISNGAFWDVKGLSSITIPNSVVEIENAAFNGCSDLTEIDIPSSVTSINISTFSNCTGLKSVTLHDGLFAIGGTAFGGCTSLTSIDLPKTLSDINSGAFYNCLNMRDIICRAETLPYTVEDSFDGLDMENITLHVPSNVIDSYKNTAPWSNFGKIVAISDDTGIKNPLIDNANNPIIYYSPTGQRYDKPQKGINIISIGKKTIKMLVR